jgi:hypothetical protein
MERGVGGCNQTLFTRDRERFVPFSDFPFTCMQFAREEKTLQITAYSYLYLTKGV